jgi:hypothetical protein
MVHEANVLATRVSQLEQAVPPVIDTYESMLVEAGTLSARVAALENAVPPVVNTRIVASDFELLGGWRINQPFARGGLAIDWTTRRLFTSGPANENYIIEYALPSDYGVGSNVLNWPVLTYVRQHPNFWGENIWAPGVGWGEGYSGGIKIENGVLWVSPKVFYETAPKLLTLYGKVLATGEILKKHTTLSQPAFGGGFVKGHAEPLLGCGGYESSQGIMWGPTCAREDSSLILSYPTINNRTWDGVPPRAPNYFIEPGNPAWLGDNPRIVNGVLEGRWACDRVHGGGIWHPHGMCYWGLMGTGSLSYAYQTEMFSLGENKECYLYTYDAQTFSKSSVQYTKWNHGLVEGNEIDSAGNVYLHCRNQWSSGMYKVDAAVKIFRVRNG